MKRIGDVTLRAAAAADPPRLPDVEDAAGEMFRDVGMPDVAEMAARTVEDHEEALAAGLLWVADADGLGPVGFALASAMQGSLYLAELSVRPSHGRRGLGTALVECVAEEAAARGYRAVTLSTFTHVPWNAPYYRRLGFVDLPPEGLPDELRAVREREAAVGLDLGQRVIMRRALDGAPRRA